VIRILYVHPFKDKASVTALI